MLNYATIKENELRPVSSARPVQSNTGRSVFQLQDNRPRSAAGPAISQTWLTDNRPRSIVQRNQAAELADYQPAYTGVQRKSNRTGLPDKLKSGIENLSGISMDDVNVHYHSDKPARLHAHAYAQGTDIHIGPGQEKHLPHEAWHVVQQKQGRVKATLQMKSGDKINDDNVLEKEADEMGSRAIVQRKETGQTNLKQLRNINTGMNTVPVLQAVWEDFGLYYVWDPVYPDGTRWYQIKSNSLLFYLIEHADRVPPEYLEKYRQDAGIANAKSYTDWLNDESYNWLLSADDNTREEAVPEMDPTASAHHSASAAAKEENTGTASAHKKPGHAPLLAASAAAFAEAPPQPHADPAVEREVREGIRPIYESILIAWRAQQHCKVLNQEIEECNLELEALVKVKGETRDIKKIKSLKKVIEEKEDLLEKPEEIVNKETKSQKKLRIEFLTLINTKLIRRGGKDTIKSFRTNWQLIDSASNEGEIFEDMAKTVRSICNSIDYINQFGENLNPHLVRLFKEFNLTPPEGFNIENVTFTIQLLGGDSHNKGKVPVLILFFEKGTPLGKIVYKPRKAETDRAVIDLYAQMNQLGSPINLPVYKIISVGEGSFWEFVDGQLLEQDSAHKQANAANVGNLLRLEQVTSAVGISDLHKENVILRGNEFVPIDLESYDPESETGLYGGSVRPAPQPFSEKEQLLINNFKKLQVERESRLVPVATGILEGLMNGNDTAKAVAMICSALTEKGFSLAANSKDRLLLLITEDFQHLDIPMFTQKGGAVFFVGDSSGLPIAIKPGTDE